MKHHRSSVRPVAAAAVAVASMFFQSSQAAGAAQWASGRLLMMPRAGLPEAALSRILGESGARAVARVGKTELRIVHVPPGLEKQVVERLARNPHVKFAELDMRVPESLVSNDPYLSSQWHLSKIRALEAWDASAGAGVTVAVLDSGIDTLHPDFGGRLLRGYNFVDGNGDVTDVRSHGTKVAGAVAATLNNATGVASVAGATQVLPVRVSDSTGYVYWSTMATGLTWAADQGARVAVMSFNGVAGSSSVLSAAKYLKDRGGLAFVSAGNSNTDPGYANTSSMIIVAATDGNDAKASFSNYGDHVHLAAPGVSIYSTTWGQTYASVSGTSFSAPITAGVAALVMSANPKLSAAEVEKILFATAVDLGAPGRDIYFGYGRVDAAAAVAAALTTVSTVDTTPPSASIAAPLAGNTVSGLVAVDVNASDNIGVAKVELRADGATIGTDTSAPFQFSWDSTKAPNGSVTLSAVAYDAAGNSQASPGVTVTVGNAIAADTVAPVVTFTNPGNGDGVWGNVKIRVSVSDNADVANLRQSLYIDGVLRASSTGGTLAYDWNARKSTMGSHTISAVATDAAGNSSTQTIVVKRVK